MTTASNSAILDPVTNPVLTVAPQNKEDTTMSGATNKITALYCRLSQEDARLGESLSIENQKVILLEYAKKNHFPNPVFFVDDGYSGTNYDRPGFQSMLVEIEAGRVGIVITKDLSRLGRNSALTGLYTNFTFPQYGVRYIAINDNYDTIDPNSVNNDFAGIKNWFNEFYARDTSRKIRAVQKAKGERGVPLLALTTSNPVSGRFYFILFRSQHLHHDDLIPVGAVFQLKGPGLDAIALKPKLLIEMDGTGVIAVHPQFQLFKSIGPGLVHSQLHQKMTKAAAPIFLFDGDAHNRTVPGLQGILDAADSHVADLFFPIEHAHFKVDGTFLTGCQTIPNLLQLIMAFFRIACKKMSFTIRCVLEFTVCLCICGRYAAHCQHFPAGQCERSGFDLHIPLSSSFRYVLAPIPAEQPIAARCGTSALLLP